MLAKFEPLFEDTRPGSIHERYGQRTGRWIGFEQTEKLQTGIRRTIRLQIRGHTLESHLGSEREIELTHGEGPGVRRAGDKLPERIEVFRGARSGSKWCAAQ